jgi:hypothetical protein
MDAKLDTSERRESDGFNQRPFNTGMMMAIFGRMGYTFWGLDLTGYSFGLESIA